MTNKASFSPEEWKVVLEGPPAAGLMVITAAHGGTFRETFAMSKAYAEARAEHGESELLDEIVSAKPKADHTRYHSADELRDGGLGHLRDAMALLESKATAEERDDYRRFVITLANKVAAAHRRARAEREPRGGSGHPADHGGARRGRLLTGTASRAETQAEWQRAGGSGAGCGVVAGERAGIHGGRAGHQHGAGGRPGLGIAAAARAVGGSAAGAHRRPARLRRSRAPGPGAASGPARA